MRLAWTPLYFAGPILVAAACLDSTLSGQPGVSRSESCTPGDMQCTADGNAEICRPNGTGYDATACPTGQRCVTSTCNGTHTFTPGCYDILCEPTANRCDPTDNIRVESCDVTGTDWCCVASCGTPEVDGVCYHGSCVSVCASGEKSYIGCEYFAVDLDNADVPCGTDSNGNVIECNANAQQYAVVIANPDLENEVVYLVTNGPPSPPVGGDECAPPPAVVAAGTLPPKGLQIIDLPARHPYGTRQAMLAYRVAANAPITAYQFNPLDNVGVFSNDATVLLPVNAVGQKYYIMTREETFDDLKGYLTVVGVTNTPANVTVTVTARTLAGPGIPALIPGDKFSTTLSRYEVLNIETNWIGADLTGSYVTSDQPIVVFGGSQAADAPNTDHCDAATGKCAFDESTPCVCTDQDGPLCNPQDKCSQFITCCADHLEMQLFPTDTWGKEYVAVRTKRRGLEKNLWRILADADLTHVTLTPPTAVVPVLAQGEWFEFESDDDFLVSADKPVLVGQFMEAEQAPNPGHQPGDANIGDPSFMLAAPTRQLRTNYVFLAPKFYDEHFVSIGAQANTSVSLDGEEVLSLNPDTRAVDWRDIAGTTWRAIRVSVSEGYHVLSCAQPCSVMVHGYAQYVSYGYPGGLNLNVESP